MKRYASIVVGVLVAAVCVRLGVWQLDRLAQRQAANATLRAQLEAPVLAVDTTTAWRDPAAADVLRYRRVTGTGTFDFDREIIVMARVHRGVPGVHVVTPLKIGDSLAILVERGWVPAPDGKRPAIDLAEVAQEGVIVSGVLIPPSERPMERADPGGWPRYVTALNTSMLSAEYPYAVAPLTLRRAELPAAAPIAMRAIPLPPITNGPHLSYAVQWFAFATIALVGSSILFRRQGKQQRGLTTA